MLRRSSDLADLQIMLSLLVPDLLTQNLLIKLIQNVQKELQSPEKSYLRQNVRDLIGFAIGQSAKVKAWAKAYH